MIINKKILKQFEINRFNKLLFNRKFLNNTGLLVFQILENKPFAIWFLLESIEIKISYWI